MKVGGRDVVFFAKRIMKMKLDDLIGRIDKSGIVYKEIGVFGSTARGFVLLGVTSTCVL